MTRRLLFVLVLAFLLRPPPMRADAPPVPAPTLAQALAEAETPHEDVYLTVAPNRVVLPPDAAPPQKGALVRLVAAAYDRLAWEFGGVVALVPPTMTVLDTDPGTPNPYDGMPPTDVLKLLLGSLSDAQWRAVTGEAGLGDADLTGDSQHALFQALFPAGTLTVRRQYDPTEMAHIGDPITLNADALKAVRLRLGQKVQISLPLDGPNKGTLTWGSPPLAGKVLYTLDGGFSGGRKATLFGVAVRQTVPNVPKPSDLDFDRAALTQKIPLDGIKTVGDLISRIGGALKVEMYADRRYEKRPVLLMGPPSARAKDLLRALALCLAGAYRRVGPAYVLTDDLRGTGTRRTILVRVAQEAETARQEALADAGDRLVTERGGSDGLLPFGDDLALNDAEKSLAPPPGQLRVPGQGMSLSLPLAQLTPAQQEEARREVEGWNASQQAPSQPFGIGIGRATLTGQFGLSAQTVLQLLSPAVPGPVPLNGIDVWHLFHPSSKLMQKFFASRNYPQPQPPGLAPAQPVTPSLASLLTPISRRAVIARPRTDQEVDSLIAAMKVIGFNQLWLDVFSRGKSHLDGTPDILAEALARAKGTGIVVIPTLDLLKWGVDAPPEARDLSLMGETSAQAQAWQQHYTGIVNQGLTPAEADKQPAPSELSVCPVAPSVQTVLMSLVRRLAATPGVGALVLRETATPGYERPLDYSFNSTSDAGLGYVPALRLAFLRRDHVDPVDLDVGVPNSSVALDTSLPEFDEGEQIGDANKDWNRFRWGANRDLLQRLLAAARQSAGPRFPFLIKQRHYTGGGNWYSLWDDPRVPLPDISERAALGNIGMETDYAAFAHSLWRTNLSELDPWAGKSKGNLVAALQQRKPGWDGFVLDLSDDASGSALADLAGSLTPPKPEAAKLPQK